MMLTSSTCFSSPGSPTHFLVTSGSHFSESHFSPLKNGVLRILDFCEKHLLLKDSEVI